MFRFDQAVAVRRFAKMTLVAGLAAMPVAQAQEVKPVGQFGWFGVGKAYELEKGHYYWVGEFSGTFFNDKGEGSPFHLAGVKCPAFNDINFVTGTGKSGGYCIMADADGDQAYLSWQLSGAPKRATGSFTFTGGTGKYKDIRGTSPFTGVTQINWADGTASGYSIWNR
jgi:hypothetical protein